MPSNRYYFFVVVLRFILSMATVAEAAKRESKFAAVNGVRLHLLQAGTDKTPLVLIHGFGSRAQEILRQISF